MRVVKNVKRDGKCSKEWACNYSGCDKRYHRKQELKRHTKDKHEDPDNCPFCCFTWTRPDKMGSHLLGEHGSQFTKEECREIRGLRGRDVMISFLAKCIVEQQESQAITRPGNRFQVHPDRFSGRYLS
jgi:hypothetical protein